LEKTLAFTAEVTARIFETPSGKPASGLNPEAFIARIDGLETPILNWEDLGAGRYAFAFSLEDISEGGYYLSVEVMDSSLHGEGWLRFIVE
jgi:hypothetical protein